MWKVNPQIHLSGVCFGHQVNCRALGAIVEQSPSSWELSHTEIKLTDVGKKLFGEDALSLHQMHQDHVKNPPSRETDKAGCMGKDDEVHVWGSSDDCKIQGIYIPKRIFTSQGHLGYDEHMVKKEIEAREEKGLLGDHAGEGVTSSEEAQKAKDRAKLEHDGEVVAGAFLRFFAGWDD